MEPSRVLDAYLNTVEFLTALAEEVNAEYRATSERQNTLIVEQGRQLEELRVQAKGHASLDPEAAKLAAWLKKETSIHDPFEMAPEVMREIIRLRQIEREATEQTATLTRQLEEANAACQESTELVLRQSEELDKEREVLRLEKEDAQRRVDVFANGLDKAAEEAMQRGKVIEAKDVEIAELKARIASLEEGARVAAASINFGETQQSNEIAGLRQLNAELTASVDRANKRHDETSGVNAEFSRRISTLAAKLRAVLNHEEGSAVTFGHVVASLEDEVVHITETFLHVDTGREVNVTSFNKAERKATVRQGPLDRWLQPHGGRKQQWTLVVPFESLVRMPKGAPVG